MPRNSCFALWITFIAVLLPLKAQAHFLRLVQQTSPELGEALHLHFGELAEPDGPAQLERVDDVTVWQVGSDRTRKRVPLHRGTESMVARITEHGSKAIYLLTTTSTE